MKNFYQPIFLLLISIFITIGSYAQKPQEKLNYQTQWSAENLPKELSGGLAGSAFGKVGDYFIVAGGSSFPDGKPWQGGKKYLSNHILIFDKNYKLVDDKAELLYGLSDAAYVSTPNELICIGGQTSDGLTHQVLGISYELSKIKIKNYPELPIKIKAASATVIGSKVYVLGGQTSDGKSSQQFWVLDTKELEKGWQPLADYPLPVSAAAMTAQQNGTEVAIFVFGGRAKTSEITKFYHTTYSYIPSINQWVEKSPITIDQHTENLAAANALSVGASSILLIGGDTGKIYNQVEKAINENDTQRRDSLWIHHSGFNREVLVYSTITDEWFVKSELENSVAVGATYSDGKNIYLFGGEIKPGIRYPYFSTISLEKKSQFGWVNYTVLVVYFLGMLLLGFFFMKNNSNTDDYFKAGGRIPWWAAGISIFATTLSAITFISIPAKSYATDWRMFLFNMGIIIAAPIIIRYFLPFFLRFNFSTAYQYLEARFSRSVRWIAAALFLFFMISRIAIVLFLPSLALNAVTGFSVYYSVIIMSIITIIYSTSGGMEAVVWGDVIQGFILVLGAISAFVFMIIGIEGGLSTFWETTIEYHKLHIFDFSFDWSQPVFWVVIIGGFANTIISYTSDQSVVQRYMTTKDEKSTAKSIWLNGIISVPVSILFFLLGTGLFAFYKANPQVASLTNPNVDSVFPQFIVSEMPIGFAGLLIAAIFAAAMSTLSSNINSASAVVTSDFFKTFYPKSELKMDIRVAQLSGIVMGLLGMGMALVLATWNIASLWDQFNTFLGLITSGLGALFLMGIFFPRINAISALIGVAVGIMVLYYTKDNTSLSFLLYGFLGMVSSILVAWLCSWVFPNKKSIEGLTWKSRKK